MLNDTAHLNARLTRSRGWRAKKRRRKHRPAETDGRAGMLITILSRRGPGRDFRRPFVDPRCDLSLPSRAEAPRCMYLRVAVDE